MSRYAEGTDVSSERSKAEIERTLTRYGADQFMYGWKEGGAFVGFRAQGRMIRFYLPLPNKDSDEFTRSPTGKPRSAQAAYTAYEQATRQRWRALSLVIKAKLEAVESGIAEFDEEFLAYIVLPGGQTVGETMVPQIEVAYTTGKMPALMPSKDGQ
jgi:hypothetical protein